MYQVLLVEDDRQISEMLCNYLSGEIFRVDPVFYGRHAEEQLRREKYHLILLDLMLPDCSGIELIKLVRKFSIVPILVVTAKDQDTEKAIALNLGADDYITKPFSLIELSARMTALIRRATRYSAHCADDVIHIQDLTIDVSRHIVKREDTVLSLTHTEFEMIRLLAASPGVAFSKEQLYCRIWKESYYGNEHVLNTHMNRLRGKLKAANPQGEYIKTLWGIGYKMEAHGHDDHLD